MSTFSSRRKLALFGRTMRVPPLGYALFFALGLGGAALYVRHRAEGESARHGRLARDSALPTLAIGHELADEITRIELLQPGGDDSSRAITLEKRSDGWRLTAPIETSANAANVRALIDDLKALRLSDLIDSRNTYDERYGLADAQAFHVRAFRGADLLRDLYFGKSSARGQLLRVAGVPGVFSIDREGPGSYSGFLYTRPLETWRDRSILEFDEEQALEVQIENRHGRFVFIRRGPSWSASANARRPDGTLQAKDQAWAGFDESKVRDLLHAFHSLSADEWGKAGDFARSGLDRAEQSGGVITIRLRDGTESTVRIGNPASGPSSWAIQNSRWAIKADGDGTLYALALWVTDWVTSDASKFLPAKAVRPRQAQNVRSTIGN